MHNNNNALCVECRSKLDKNAMGLNYKYLGTTITKFYCMECLAEYLDIGLNDLYRQIEYFKESGCVFFD